MPTFVHLDGFEHGVISTAGAGLYDTLVGTGTSTIEAASARSGSRGLTVTTSATNRYLSVNISGTQTLLVGVAYLRYPTLPSQEQVNLEAELDPTAFCRLGLDSSNLLFADFFDVSQQGRQTRTGAISANTWYRIDFRFNVGGATWTIDWQVAEGDASGTAQTQASYAKGSAATDIVSFRRGLLATGTTTVHIDDVGLSTTTGDYPIGGMKVLGYSPNAVGTHSFDAATSSFFFKDIGATETALTTSETTSYQQIDDVPIDADSDHVFVRASTPASTFADPDGNGTATGWTNDWQNVDDGVRQPTAPSDGLTISGTTTDETSETLTFTNPTFVSGATYRLWVYGTGGTKRAVDAAYSYNGSDPGTGAANRAQLIAAGAAAAWVSRDLAAPANQTELDALRVQLITNTTAGGGGATAPTVDAVYLEIIPGTTQPTNTWYLEYGVGDSAEATAPISVRGYVVLNQDSAANCSITAKLRANSNEGDIYSGDINSASKIYKTAIFNTAPGGAAWTDTIFDGATIRYGYTADADGTPRLEAALLEAAFAASGSTVTLSSTIAGTGTLTSDFVRDKRVFSVGVASTGALSPNLVRSNLMLATTIAGSGNVTAANSVTRSIATQIAGVGSVTVDFVRVKLLETAISALSTLTADFVRDKRTLNVVISGASALAADVTVTAGTVLARLRTLLGVGQ